MVATLPRRPSAGPLLRSWRQRRRLSQLELSVRTGVSTRHLSFVETGRSAPSREMLLYLAEELEVPLRERNTLLLAAGFAPSYRETDWHDPAMAPVRDALERVLAGYGPYPAIAVDRHWQMVTANAAAGLFTALLPDGLLGPPLNVIRASLHPDGLAPHIANLAEWRHHLISRLDRESAATGDGDLAALAAEARSYGVPGEGAGGGPEGPATAAAPDGAGDPGLGALAVPLRLRTGDGELTFLSTVTTFGTAIDVTLAELSVEAFLPADAATSEALTGRARTPPLAPHAGTGG